MAEPAPGAVWSELTAGAACPKSLVALTSGPLGALSGPQLVDAIVASEKALSLLAGVQMRLLAALAVPFAAGDPMRLAARLARNRCITGDDDPDQVQHHVAEAASCLAAAEVGAALRISPVTAGIRVREATAMTTELAPTLTALEAGRLDRGKAKVIAEHCRPLTDEHTAAVQDLVLGVADTLSTSELRELTAQTVIIVDPAGAEDRHERAAARRDLTLKAQPDAMATLTGFLPADGAVKICQISDLLATGTAGGAGDTRGIGARRIDALVDIADQLLTHGQLDLGHFLGRNADDRTGGPDTVASGSEADDGRDGADGADRHDRRGPRGGAADRPDPEHPASNGSGRGNRVLTRQGRRPHLSVTIGLSTLAGLDQLPGALAGFGAIPATLARAIATSAGTVTAVVTDPATGIPTGAGDLTYRPRQQLRDKAAELFTGCQFPSCRQPVWRCDLDHRVPFDHRDPRAGGPTTGDNIGPLCERHHLMKHHTEWRMHVDTTQYVLHLTSPTGHRYTSRSRPPLIPDLRVDANPGGTAIAERLDARALYAAAAGVSRTADSIEQRMTTLLLRHHLNRPLREYIPDPTAWDLPTGTRPQNLDARTDGTPDAGDHNEAAPPF